MKNKLIAMTVVIAAVATPALADDWDFVLTNSTGKTIKTVEVSPAGASTWQANKVDPEAKQSDGLKAGGRMTVHFTKSASQCKFDLQGTFDDGSKAVWSGINVCDNSFVTLRYANNAPTYAAN